MAVIELSKGMQAVIDDGDLDFVSRWKWHALRGTNTWYAARTETVDGTGARRRKRTILLHRVLASAVTGALVDHRDGNGLNNRRENLRCCTRSQNAANMPKRRVGTTSRYKGVRRQTNSVTGGYFRGWLSSIVVNGELFVIGRYATEAAAAEAYDARAREVFGEFANLNFPDAGGTHDGGRADGSGG